MRLQCTNGARCRVLVQADGEGREDRRAVAVGMAVERFVDMFEAALHRDAVPRKKRQLRRVPREAFERGKAVERGKLADRIHPGVQVERRKTRPGLRISATRSPISFLTLASGSVAIVRPS